MRPEFLPRCMAGDDRLAPVEAALEIDVDRVVPLLLAYFEQPLGARTACIVDQDTSMRPHSVLEHVARDDPSRARHAPSDIGRRTIAQSYTELRFDFRFAFSGSLSSREHRRGRCRVTLASDGMRATAPNSSRTTRYDGHRSITMRHRYLISSKRIPSRTRVWLTGSILTNSRIKVNEEFHDVNGRSHI